MTSTLNCLNASPDWDFPIYKVLANNDTGAARGHQGGIVIPKDIRPFFPGLSEKTSSNNPTQDRRVEAELYIENQYKGLVSTRYQYQTWGGTRSAESRLTDKLGPIRNLAIGGDILIIQRNMTRLDSYRLTLVPQSSVHFAVVASLANGRSWGILKIDTPPVSETDVELALEEERLSEANEFQMIDLSPTRITARVNRVARSIVFRSKILDLYEKKCAICGEGFITPSGLSETDAAHIVPRSQFGADDARNGLALCKRHHWAFDKGLFGINDEKQVIISDVVSTIPLNISLKIIKGSSLRPAIEPSLSVHPDALRWHRENIMIV